MEVPIGERRIDLAEDREEIFDPWLISSAA
jgi:hypothetical protein